MKNSHETMMKPSQNEQLAAGIAMLQKRFRESAEDRILRLEAAAILLRENMVHPEALGVIRRDCHKLAGIAPSLGFAIIGELATRIDELFILNRGEWALIEAPLEALLDALEEISE